MKKTLKMEFSQNLVFEALDFYFNFPIFISNLKIQEYIIQKKNYFKATTKLKKYYIIGKQF